MINWRCVFQIILLFVYSSTLSQHKNDSSSKMSWGIHINPGISFRVLDYIEKENPISKLRNQNEIPKFGYQLGISGLRRISNKGSIELGISYLNIGYNTRKLDCIWTAPQSSYPEYIKIKQSFKFVGLSLMYKHLIIDNNFNLFFSLGGSINELLSRKTMVLEYVGSERSKHASSIRTGFSETYLNGLISLGTKFIVSKNISFIVEPTYSRGLTSVLLGSNSNEYLNHYHIKLLFLYSRR